MASGGSWQIVVVQARLYVERTSHSGSQSVAVGCSRSWWVVVDSQRLARENPGLFNSRYAIIVIRILVISLLIVKRVIC